MTKKSRFCVQCFANESAVAHIFVLIFAGCSYQICLKIVTICHTRSQLGMPLIPSHNPLWLLMAPFTTPELRNSMVIWWYEQQKTILEISKLAHCSERTVYDVLRLHRLYGHYETHTSWILTWEFNLIVGEITHIRWRNVCKYTGCMSNSWLNFGQIIMGENLLV